MITGQDFVVYRGETRSIFIDIDLSSGGDFDPAGATMRWWAGHSSSSLPDDGVVIEKDLTNGITVVPSPDSGVTVDLESDDTIDLTPGLYYHELKVFLADGGISAACCGTMVLKPSFDMRNP